MTVDAYADPARTSLLQTYSYTIDLALDTDGPIRVDPSLGSNEVIVDPAIAADTVNPYAQVAILGSAPQVEAVIVKSSQGHHPDYWIPGGGGEQIRTVPVGGADMITIVFDEPVFTSSSSVLSLEGLHTSTTNYVATQLASFSGNGTRTLTWTFSAPLTTDQIVLRLDAAGIVDDRGEQLDGEWINPTSVADMTSVVSTFPSGDGYAGGNFEFYCTMLFGDADRSNLVNLNTDIFPSLAHIGVPGAYGWGDGDFSGDTSVNLNTDIFPALANIGTAFFQEWGGQAMRAASGGERWSSELQDVLTFRQLMEKHGVTKRGKLTESLTIAQWNEFVDEVYDVFDYEPLSLAS